jgi:predicted DCC family thiol-disulfide oxidoreductase YuxK
MIAGAMEILIDGGCAVCRREGEALRRRDRGRGRLAIVDIAGAGFDAAEYGATRDELMRRIHARMPDGSVVSGLEVFRRAYARVCPVLGWVWAPTGWPVLRRVCDRVYEWFARNRHRLGTSCEGERCSVR